jgi:hypothetical protein
MSINALPHEWLAAKVQALAPDEVALMIIDTSGSIGHADTDSMLEEIYQARQLLTRRKVLR